MGIPGIRVVHAIPGRVRLKIISLRDNPELAREIRARLAGLQGIRRVEANPLTGSLLVLYDPEEITSLAGGFSTALGALNARVGNVTGGIDLRLLLPLTLFALGIRGLLVASKVPVPTWYDLLWFSFGTYFMLNRPESRGAP
jgi:hypothetical protein